MDHQIFKDIKAALPKKLKGSNCVKIQQNLQMCLTVVENTHDDEMCYAELKTGIVCLIKILRLWVSSYPVESDDNILNMILDFMTAARDHGVKSSSYVASLMTSVCLDIVLKDKFAILTKIEVLNKLNFIFEGTDSSLKEKLLQTEYFESNLSQVFKSVLDVGDYEFQVCLMEFTCRLIPRKLRIEYSSSMIEDPEIRQAYLAVRDSYFEIDCRKFLNYVNSSQDKDNRKVFSYPCQSMTFGNVQLQKPCDMGYNDFWWDINLDSKRIIIFCQSTQPSSQMSFDDTWDNVSVWQADVDKCVCQEEQDELHVKLHIKSTAQCIPHGCDDPFPILHIVASGQHDLKTVLSQFLGKTVISKDERDGSRSLAQKSVKAHSPVSEVSSLLTSLRKKISEPSEPMSTPASSVFVDSVFSHATGSPAKSRKASSVCSPQIVHYEERHDSSQSALRRSKRLESKSPLSSDQRVSGGKTQSVSRADVSGRESCRRSHSSQRQTPMSQLSGETDNLLSQSRGRPAAKKSAIQPGGERKNFVDDDKLKQVQTDQSVSGCARYAFRECTNRQSRSKERAQILGKTEPKSKVQTVSAHKVGSDSLKYETIESLKTKMCDQTSKTKKDAKSKISEEKLKPRKDGAKISGFRSGAGKNVSENSLKTDFVSDSKRESDDCQVTGCTTGKKSASDQPLNKRETRSELLKSATLQRVEKQIATEGEACRLESNTENCQKSDFSSSCQYRSPGLESLQKNSANKPEKNGQVLVSQSSNAKQSHSRKLLSAAEKSKTHSPALDDGGGDNDRGDLNWRFVTDDEESEITEKNDQERSTRNDLQKRICQDESDQNEAHGKGSREGFKQIDLQERNPQEKSGQNDRQWRSNRERPRQNDEQVRNCQERSKQKEHKERSKQKEHKERSKQKEGQEKNDQERFRSKQNDQQERSKQDTQWKRNSQERSRQNDQLERNSQERSREKDQLERNSQERSREKDQLERNSQERSREKDQLERNSQERSREKDQLERNSQERSRENDQLERDFQGRSKQNDQLERNSQGRSRQNDQQERDFQGRSRQNDQKEKNFLKRSKQNDQLERNVQESRKQNVQKERDYQEKSIQNDQQRKNYRKRSKQNDLQEVVCVEGSEQNNRQKAYKPCYREEHDQAVHCSGKAASSEHKGKDRYGLGTTVQKNELCQEHKTPVANIAKKTDSQAGHSSLSSEKNMYWMHLVSVAQGCEKDEDNYSMGDDSQNGSQNYKKETAENPETDAALSRDTKLSHSRNESGRKSGCFSSKVGRFDDESKRKPTTEGSTPKTINFQIKEKPSKRLFDSSYLSSVRRLREKLPVSYQESIDSLEDCGKDSEPPRTAQEAESSEASKTKNRKKARFSQTGNVLTQKGRRARNNSSSSTTSIIPISFASLDGEVSPIKFISPDPWTHNAGNDLYQVTPTECQEKRKKKNVDNEKAELPVTSERDSQKRQTACLGKRKSPSVKSNVEEDSDVETVCTDKKSEISWIAEYKSGNGHKERSQKTYRKSYGSPRSPHDLSFKAKFGLIETTRTFRRGEPAVVASHYSIQISDSSDLSSLETTPKRNCQSVEHLDADGKLSEKSKASLNFSQTSRTSFCGSAVSQQSFLSQLSDRLTSEQIDISEAVTERQLQYTEEESSPLPSPGITGDSPWKTAPVRCSSRARKRQQSNEESHQLKRLGLVSGPSSVIRPSKSALKRKFEDDSISDCEIDEEDGIPLTKHLHLQPRQLFTGGTSKVTRESHGFDKGYPNERPVALEADAATGTSEASEEETPVLEDSQSQFQSEMNAEQPGVSLATAMKGFSSDLQKHARTREFQVQQLAFGALKLSNKRVNQLWTEDKKQWEQVVSEFKEQIDRELSSLEHEVADLSKVEKKSQAIHLEQLKLLCDKRKKLQKGVDTARRCYENFEAKSHQTHSHTLKVQRELESQMKQDMDRLKNKLLLDMQFQQLKRVKESIHKHFI